MELSEMQNGALKNIQDWWDDLSGYIPEEHDEAPVHYLAGFAGSGKSTMVPSILGALGLYPSDVAFLAPTGKAAKVMTEKLVTEFGQNETNYAKTIHSGIYLPTRSKPEKLTDDLMKLEAKRRELVQEIVGEFKCENPTFEGVPQRVTEENPDILALDAQIKVVRRNLDQAIVANEGPTFQLNGASKVTEKRLIVVDEASMVGARVGADLRFFGVPILAIGDPFQLPPVKDDAGLTAGTPDSFLTEIHRQAKGNPIIELAHQIRKGNMPSEGTMGDSCRVVRRRHDEWTLNEEYDAQVIVGTNAKRWNLTSKIRAMCGFTSTGPMEGEPMIICRNSQRVREFVNGTFVTCLEDVGDLEEGAAVFHIKVQDEAGRAAGINCVQSLLEEHYLGKNKFTAEKNEVYAARRNNEFIDWGWVITAHKSQGSQWPNVVVHDESSCFGRDEDKSIPFRWLYTAVTRAQEELTIVI